MIEMLLMLANPIAQTQDIVILGPRSPKFELILRASCSQNNYDISIENDGFVSKLLYSRVNGKEVELTSRQGNLKRFLSTAHSVGLAVSGCEERGEIIIAVSGVSDDPSSEERGKVVHRFFGTGPL